MLSHFTLVWLLATPWTVACKVPQSMGFQTRIWSRLPFSPPWDLLDQGIKPTSLASPTLTGGFFITSSTWDAIVYPYQTIYHLSTMPNSPTLWFWSERAWSWIRVPGSMSGLGKKKNSCTVTSRTTKSVYKELHSPSHPFGTTNSGNLCSLPVPSLLPKHGLGERPWQQWAGLILQAFQPLSIDPALSHALGPDCTLQIFAFII